MHILIITSKFSVFIISNSWNIGFQWKDDKISIFEDIVNLKLARQINIPEAIDIKNNSETAMSKEMVNIWSQKNAQEASNYRRKWLEGCKRCENGPKIICCQIQDDQVY